MDAELDQPTFQPDEAGTSGTSARIDVRNLSAESTKRQLRDLFAPFGAVEHVEVVDDDPAGRRSARALIVMPNGAEAAITAVDGYRLNGRHLRVRRARGYSDLASLRAAIEEAGRC